MSSQPPRPLVRHAARGLVLGLLVAPLAAGDGGAALPSTLLPVNPRPIEYLPPERLALGPAATEEALNVFLPPGPAPVGGLPVLVTTGFGGGVATPPASYLQDVGPSSPLHAFVAAGIAVVSFGVTGVGNGQGMWYPAGHPSGRYESFAPEDDNPEKLAEWALQWVKVQTEYPFDLDRVALRGSSGGAVLAVRTAMGPDRARATGSAQVRASTRVKALLVLQPPADVWAIAQGPELTIPLPAHLERADQPGVPASQLSQVDEDLQKDYSILRFAFESAEARANNAHQAICMVYGDPVLRIGGQVATMALDASGFPVLHDAILQPYQHDSWFGYMFFRMLRGLSPEAATFHARSSVFAMRDLYALPPPLDDHTVTYSGTFRGQEATQIGHDWLVSQLCPVPPRPYGCGLNPEGSLVHLDGTSSLGDLLSLGVDDPTGSRAPGALPLLLLSTERAGTACGPLLPGFGLDGGAGELLLRLGGARLGVLTGPPWTGAGNPAPIALRVPDEPAFLGASLFVQGVLYGAPPVPSAQPFGLTRALEVVLSP